MKNTSMLCVFAMLSWQAKAQTLPEQKFAQTALEADLDFIQTQLYEVHANPFTELDSLQYNARFRAARAMLRDSMTALDLLQIVKPLFAPLSDEHARVSVDVDRTRLRDARVFLPFSLQKRGTAYVVQDLVAEGTGLSVGDTVSSIEGVDIQDIVQQCAEFTTGFPNQRLSKAMTLMGTLYVFAYPNKESYQLQSTRRTRQVAGTDFQHWRDYQLSKKEASKCEDRIIYQRFEKTGYINFCSFSIGSDSAFHQLELRMAAIFKQIKKDKIETLVVDVQNNPGGNSSCGDLIIGYFYDKPYLGYQCSWKRSEAYLDLMKQWGSNNQQYQNSPVGSTLKYPAAQHHPPRRLKNRFKGKVYVVVGANTFSSAIMFATIIKDNHIATLVGRTPDNGHPNHFGEMYGSTTPNTRLSLQFGVKTWIRPSGVLENNELQPNRFIDLEKVSNTADLIFRILH